MTFDAAQMLLSALQKRPELPSEADLEEEARQLSATAKSEAMKGARRHRWASGATLLHLAHYCACSAVGQTAAHLGLQPADASWQFP